MGSSYKYIFTLRRTKLFSFITLEILHISVFYFFEFFNIFLYFSTFLKNIFSFSLHTLALYANRCFLASNTNHNHFRLFRSFYFWRQFDVHYNFHKWILVYNLRSTHASGLDHTLDVIDCTNCTTRIWELRII